MDIKEIVEDLYSKIEDQHQRLEEISTNLKHFNLVMAKQRIGEVIRTYDEIRERIDTLPDCEFKTNFETIINFITGTYSNYPLYSQCADPESRSIPPTDFMEAFINETRGTLYFMTALLNYLVIPSLPEREKHRYIKSAMESSIQSLEAAIQESEETILAKKLIELAKQSLEIYLEISQQIT